MSTTTVAVATDDSQKPYGDVKYADPGYQSDGVKRYPIDTEAHIRAAWSYINMPKNASKYASADLKKVKARIAAAMRRLGVDVTSAAKVATHVIKNAKGDCPPDHHKMPNGDCMPDEEMPSKATDSYAAEGLETLDPQVTPLTSAPWNGVLTVEGIESGDGRMFEGNSLAWDNLPLPLRWQKETAHGGQNDVTVEIGSIDKIWRQPAADGRPVFYIMGEGSIDLENADGAEAYRRMKKGYMRGNSVDVDSVKDADVEMRFAEPKMTPGEDGKPAMDMQQMFARPELTVYKKGRIRATTLVSIPAFTEAQLSLSDDQPTAVPAQGDPEADERMSTLVAATSIISIEDAPPREWFEEPTDVTPQGALTVTPQGRIYGYVAPAGVRHRSFPGKMQYVPMGKVDYSRFMSGETIVADGGRIATGAITMGCGHASTVVPLTAEQAAEHYDNSCSVVASVRVGESERGTWFAGALLPDLTPAQVQRIMACKLSGDWRAHLDKPGWREFVAALLVPVPGFPMARMAPSVETFDGQLVASSVPVMFSRDFGPEVHLTAEDLDAADAEVRAARVATAQRRVRVMTLQARVATRYVSATCRTM